MSLFRRYYRVPKELEEKLLNEGRSTTEARNRRYAEEDRALLAATKEELIEFRFEINRHLKSEGVTNPDDYVQFEHINELIARAKRRSRRRGVAQVAKEPEQELDIRTIIPYLIERRRWRRQK